MKIHTQITITAAARAIPANVHCSCYGYTPAAAVRAEGNSCSNSLAEMPPLLQPKPAKNLGPSHHNAGLQLATGTTHIKEAAVTRWGGSPQRLDPQGAAFAVSGLPALAAGTA